MSDRVTPRFVRAWTSERGRVHSFESRVVLTRDPDELYVLGNFRTRDALLETFDRRTGERLRALELARTFESATLVKLQPAGDGEVLALSHSEYSESRVERIALRDARVEAVWTTGGYYSDFAVSADGRTLAVAHENIEVIDLATRAVRGTFAVRARPHGSLTFSPEGTKLAWCRYADSPGDDLGGLWVLDLAEGLPRRIAADRFYASSIAFSPDARRLWVASGSELSCLDLDAGRPLRVSPKPPSAEAILAVRGDGRAALVMTWRGDIATVELDDERPTRPDAADWVRLEGELSPDGRTAACVRLGTLALYGLEGGLTTTFHEGHGAGVCALAYSPDGRRVATVGADATLFVWDAVSAEPCASFEGAPDTSFRAVAWSPEGHRLYTVNSEHALQTWGLGSLLDVTPEEPIEVPYAGLLVSADGSRALSRTGPYADPHGIFALVDLERHRAVDHAALFRRDVRREHRRDEWDLAGHLAFFARGGAEVHVIHVPDASGETLRTVLDARTGAVLREEPLAEGVSLPRMSACAPDGSQGVLMQTTDSEPRYQYELWDFAAGVRRCVHERPHGAICLYADARRVVIATTHAIEVFVRGEPVCELSLDPHWVIAMAFSPDDRTLLIGTKTGQILEYALEA
jgi:WD40 repeat protein